MKKITLLLFLCAAMAYGQSPRSILEYFNSGLHTEIIQNNAVGQTSDFVYNSQDIVSIFSDRAEYLANCVNSTLLTSEDFTGGPTALIGCGDILSSDGDSCYPAGALEENFEVTITVPGDGTVYVDPADGFGNTIPVVGANSFVDYTVLNFTGDDPVSTVGFDLYALLSGSNVDVRVFGEDGIIDTITLDVASTGPVFLGIVADEAILSLEIQDLTGVNAELIGGLLFGQCTPLDLNDTPEFAIDLNVGEIFSDFPRTDDNTGATASEETDTSIMDPSCGNYEGGDLWYTATVPESGKITFESMSDDDSITDTGLSVYEGEIGALVEVSCNDDGGLGLFSKVGLEERTPGEVLYARVWEWGGNALGTFQISAYDTPPPANDDTDGAIALTVGSEFPDFAVIASNVSATDSEVEDTTITDPSCASYSGGDIWYTVEVPSTGEVTVETNRVEGGTVTDTGMSIYEGEIGALVEVECDDDDSEDGLLSLISLTDRTPGETLYIRIWEWGNNAFGDFQVSAYSDCSVNGGTIAVTGSGNTEVNICVGDDMPDPIEVTVSGDPFGTNSGWVITDNTTGEILSLPDAPPFDLDGVEPGVCAIWNISFEDGLTGLEVGSNVADVAGCFDLSNPIIVDRVNEGTVCIMCEYTIEMNDSFGDGWNGGTIDVLVDGIVVLDNVSLDDDPNNTGAQGSLSFPVNSTAEVTTVFETEGDFPGEISYRILDADGNEVATGNVENNIEPETLFADCPTCFAPSDLDAQNITDSSVDLSWTDNNDPTAPEFTVEYGPLGFEIGSGTVVTDITDAMLTVTDLDAGTEYEFYVFAQCGAGDDDDDDNDDDSNVTGPSPFLTLPPPGECSYYLEMNDSFGDGWNGATMDVLRNGILALNNVTLGDDPDSTGSQGTLAFEILPGDDITTVFEDGGAFPGEVSYRILDANFQEAGIGDATTNIESGTITADCPTCFTPFDLEAGNFAPNSVDLSWSMPMEALGYNWEIQDVGVDQGDDGAIATGNTFIDTFDTATGPFVEGNTYTLYVQAGCTEEDFSIYNSIDFVYFSNDNCENAIALLCGDTVTGNTSSANDSGNNPSGDVFYTYTTEDVAQDVTLSLCDGNTNYDSLVRVFDDECNLVNEIAVNDDSCGLQSEVMFVALEDVTYTIMIEGFGGNTGNFSMAVSCEPNLSIESAQFESFRFYPNPAQDHINLDAQQTIEKVTIFNLLGQKVLDQKVGITNTQLDVSKLADGNYMMQVTIDGKVAAYKLLKN